MLKGFRDFITRGNVIDLAVAVVIGAAFTAVVNAIVDGLINPLIGLVFNAQSLDEAMIVTVGEADFRFGAVLGAIITFLAVAVVVYFVFVFPMNTFREHQAAKAAAGVPTDEPLTEAELLTQIRDLLAEQGAASGRRRTDV
ncbi:large conductance mechanosensitive channel protein MscL [Agromyces ramosus]|uniref:Large-conductance mechanosensitive channel n=1 Tax=Agromyces ramosus TaxID=33879 RepID=A0ABU0R763_9MICO|nr:large conductance mechanosensitive channel protein MscL [Agromyces ramosus]MDQ0893021.1 large conductance mechanosensitive channel [Agromyces ramosus]